MFFGKRKIKKRDLEFKLMKEYKFIPVDLRPAGIYDDSYLCLKEGYVVIVKRDMWAMIHPYEKWSRHGTFGEVNFLEGIIKSYTEKMGGQSGISTK